MKILIVKMGAIGDVIMALPMVETIRQKNPLTHITWVCGRGVEDLLKTYGKIDELVVVDEIGLLKGSLFRRLQVMLGLWQKLLFRRYDLVVTGYSDFRYRLLSYTVLAEKRRSFNRKKSRPQPIAGRFFGDEYVRLVTNVDGPEALQGSVPQMRVSLPESFQSLLGEREKSKLVVLVPGGAKNTLRDNAVRRWPLENYRKLASSFLELGFQVVVVGAATDDWVSSAFVDVDVINLIGKTNLVELIGVFNQCDLVVSHDCGPMHAAILAGVPLVALFGPTDPHWFADKNRKLTHVIWGGSNLACRPCYDGKNFAECENNLCMKSIEVEKVKQIAIQMLSAGK